jgi:electron transfer flavoprotein beta subunit
MTGLNIVVCGSVVPDPLQTLMPQMTEKGPGLKNEMMLPHVLDPWAAHALYEAANLTKKVPDSKIWLISLGPKAKLQQVMMTIAQKVPFELVVLDGSSSGFTESKNIAAELAKAIDSIKELDKSRLVLFGGWESACRGSGSTMQMCGEMLGIVDQFQGVDRLNILQDDTFEIYERVEGGKHQISVCDGPPIVVGWATGFLPEPPNNPQIGMTNMRKIMPSIQKAQPANLDSGEIKILNVELPKQKRETRIEKEMSVEDIAKELTNWLKSG